MSKRRGERSLCAVAGNCQFSMYLAHTFGKEQFLESNPLHNVHRIEGSGMRGFWGRSCLALLAQITSSFCVAFVHHRIKVFFLCLKKYQAK